MRKLMSRLKRRWTLFWLRKGGPGKLGKVASWLAVLFVPPYKGRAHLARMVPRGYISYCAGIQHKDLRLGKNVFIGDRVQIYRTVDGGYVEINDNVALYGDIIIETAYGGNVIIDEDAHIQPRCQLVAARGSIHIGKRAEIAPNCAFYPFNHQFTADKNIREQPIITSGNIEIGDDVWLGYGVIVLDGVHIGDGAVLGAGAVVTHDIPDNAIAVGSPARVLKYRQDVNA